ncbi:hypothetical protein, partial [Neisseria polysaccharea]|uniref:hypothetical protein n=1 Tax=Neisseria polysaccharea TaxID=489 RepID=UPI0027E1E1C3
LYHHRFVSGEEPNYTLEDVYGQYFQRDFFGNIVISLSDKVFYFRQMLRRLQQSLPPPPLTGAPL